LGLIELLELFKSIRVEGSGYRRAREGEGFNMSGIEELKKVCDEFHDLSEILVSKARALMRLVLH